MMEVAQTSHHWNSFRQSRRYELKIHLIEAEIFAADVTANPDTIHPYVVVFLKNDRDGTRKKTTVDKKKLNPRWEQTLVFVDLMYDAEFCVEIKSSRPRLQHNEFLCGFDFKLCDVLDEASCKKFTPWYNLTGGDKNSSYSGRLKAAFEHSPPVPLGGVDGMLEDPSYVTFNGNFSSILLDMYREEDDQEPQMEKDDPDWRLKIVQKVVPGMHRIQKK